MKSPAAESSRSIKTSLFQDEFKKGVFVGSVSLGIMIVWLFKIFSIFATPEPLPTTPQNTAEKIRLTQKQEEPFRIQSICQEIIDKDITRVAAKGKTEISLLLETPYRDQIVKCLERGGFEVSDNFLRRPYIRVYW
jgi:hypothetical protein